MSETVSVVDDRIIIERLGETVKLMQLVPADAQRYFDLIAYDPDHLRQFGDETADRYPDVEAVLWSIEHPANRDRYRFGIWDGDTMVGTDNLTLRGQGSAELGSWIGKQYIGQGYAGKGRSLLIEFAFGPLDLTEVYCDIMFGNDASRRSVEKSGFALSATLQHGQIWRYTYRKDQNA